MGFMKCPQCGEEVSDIAERCPRCQYMFSGDEPATPTVRWSIQQQKLKEENGGKIPEPPEKTKKAQDRAVICGAVFAVAVVIFYIIRLLW